MSSFNTPDESVQDTVAQLITGQNDANVTYDDTADQLSVDVSTLTNEEVQDIVASFVSSDSNLSWSYDDANDTLAVSLANSILVNTLEASNSINTADISAASQGDVLAKATAGDLTFNAPAQVTVSEDPNSPFKASNVVSKQFTVSNSYDVFYLIPERDNLGFDGLRLNGDVGTNYDYILNDDSRVTGDDRFDLKNPTRQIKTIKLAPSPAAGAIGFGLESNTSALNAPVYGKNNDVTAAIDTFTVIDSTSTQRSVSLRGVGIEQ